MDHPLLPLDKKQRIGIRDYFQKYSEGMSDNQYRAMVAEALLRYYLNMLVEDPIDGTNFDCLIMDIFKKVQDIHERSTPE